MSQEVPKYLVTVVMQVTLANTTFIDYQNENCYELALTLLSRLKEHQ